jgi:hypothetical protein
MLADLEHRRLRFLTLCDRRHDASKGRCAARRNLRCILFEAGLDAAISEVLAIAELLDVGAAILCQRRHGIGVADRVGLERQQLM